jgi:hypothetical protein
VGYEHPTITSVTEPAQKAGLKAGDVIESLKVRPIGVERFSKRCDSTQEYTDGFSEAMTKDDEEWGEDRMQLQLKSLGCSTRPIALPRGRLSRMT